VVATTDDTPSSARASFRDRRSRRPGVEISTSLHPVVEVLRCPRCGGPAPPYASLCPWCGGPLTPLPPPPPPPPGVPANRAADLIEGATELTLWAGDVLFGDLFQITDESGVVLARGVHGSGGIVAWTEVLLVDPSGAYLLAFRYKNRPGAQGTPMIAGNIPFVAVDDQGQTIGELLGKFNGLKGRSYTMWRQGAEYLSVPTTARRAPYPVLQRGSPVALITEGASKKLGGPPGSWKLQYTGLCSHLDVVALLVHVASHRGSPGIHGG
jgi:hypothetical protein